MSGYREVGPICPFMSTDSRNVPFLCCQREKCAAWGPIGRTLPGAAINGCRLIGGEVPE